MAEHQDIPKTTPGVDITAQLPASSKSVVANEPSRGTPTSTNTAAESQSDQVQRIDPASGDQIRLVHCPKGYCCILHTHAGNEWFWHPERKVWTAIRQEYDSRDSATVGLEGLEIEEVPE